MLMGLSRRLIVAVESLSKLAKLAVLAKAVIELEWNWQ